MGGLGIPAPQPKLRHHPRGKPPGIFCETTAGAGSGKSCDAAPGSRDLPTVPTESRFCRVEAAHSGVRRLRRRGACARSRIPGVREPAEGTPAIRKLSGSLCAESRCCAGDFASPRRKGNERGAAAGNLPDETALHLRRTS